MHIVIEQQRRAFGFDQVFGDPDDLKQKIIQIGNCCQVAGNID